MEQIFFVALQLLTVSSVSISWVLGLKMSTTTPGKTLKQFAYEIVLLLLEILSLKKVIKMYANVF